jgi:cysteine-rich repeat protein
VCGDGLVRATETCDDGDTTPGDGCDATCHAETGFTCSGQPSLCSASCGDGLILGAENCDDGCGSAGGAFPGGCGSTGGAFPVSGDGCDTSCQIELGWGCSGQPSVCTAICGDGLISGDETCDDGDLTPGDGCNGACQIEAGFICAGAPSGCVTICSDGLIVGSETCDDGDLSPGDGCNDLCRTESGYACTGHPSACSPVCGDRIVLGSETCDDGNAIGMDGCSALCRIEPGFVCAGVPSTCSAFHVVITSPENGQFFEASPVEVQGVVVSLLPAQASLRINGVSVPVAPNGTFSTSVTLDFDDIFNPIRATVTHTGTGSTVHDRVTVIAGHSVTDGAFSPKSVALRLNDSGLDQVEPLVADLAGSGLDLADLVPVGTMIVDNECFIDSVFGCLGRGTVRVANPSPSFSSFGLAIDSMTNFVAGDITVHNIRVNTHLDGSGLVPSCDINIQANAAFFNGDYSLEPNASDPTSLDVNQVGAQQVSFSGFNVSYGGICDTPIIGDIIQAFMPDVQALAIGGIAGFLADPDGGGPLDSPTADAIETALAGIQITGPIGAGLGANLDAPLFAVSEDNIGITLGSDSRFTTENGSGPGQCVPPPGAPNLTHTYATNPAFPTFGATTPVGHLPFDLGIAISSAGFNQLLKAQTECGLLVTSIDELYDLPLNALLLSALLPQFSIYPPATPFRIDVRPTVGPIVSGEPGPNGELAELKVAQILISVVTDDGGPGTVALVAAVDANIGLGLSFAPGGLGIALTPPDPSEIRVAILYNPLGVDEANLENNVLPPLVATLLPDLAGSLAGFPLPDFLGLHLDGVEVSRNGDFMSLFANLEPTP